ncbi:MAG: hypothetical protein ABIF17_00505, partial [Patescibacteria group bacterium]
YPQEKSFVAVANDTIRLDVCLEEIPVEPCFSAKFQNHLLSFKAEIFETCESDTLVLNGSQGPLVKIAVKDLYKTVDDWYCVDVSPGNLGGYVYTRFTFIYCTVWHYHSLLGCDPAEWSLIGVSLEPGNDQWFHINR